MSLYSPILAVGQSDADDVQLVSGSKNINAIAVANFPVGTPVFTSLYDDTVPIYRGLVTSVGASDVNVQITGTRNVNPGKAWNPTSYWRPTYSALRVTSRKALGIDNVRLGNGAMDRTQVMDAVEFVSFLWARALLSDINALWSFVDDTISGGVDDMTLAFYDFRTATWRLATVSLVNSEMANDPISTELGALALEFAIQTENEYT